MSIIDCIEETELFHLIEDKFVSLDCLYDEGLREWFSSPYTCKATKTCDFNGREAPCVSVADLQRHILKYFDLSPIQHFSPRADGEFLIKGVSSEDWLEDKLALHVHDDLFQDFLNNAVDEEYGQYHWQLKTPEEQWTGCWRKFRANVSVRNKKFIITDDNVDDIDRQLPDYVHPAELPARSISALSGADGFWEMPKGYQIYRLQEGKCERSFDRLTSAPDDIAGLNRFSLAGVSMFYGAPEENTAAQEIDLKTGDEYTYGLFETTQPLLILDLVNYKKPLGNFDPRWQSQYHIAKFLEGFTKDVSKPITDKANDYLPTQAFCDFILHEGLEKLKQLSSNAGLESLEGELPDDPIFMPLRHNKIHGIRYTSSRNNKESVVLFCNQEKSKDLLSMPDSGHRTCANTPFDNEELLKTLKYRLT